MKDAEFEFSTFFEMTPDLVCIASKEGFFKKINQAVINKLGYTAEELYSRPIASFIHPEDQHQTGVTRNELLNGKALLNFVNRYMTKTGGMVWLQWTSIYISDREVVFAIAKDVTTIKQMEIQAEERYLKLKGLASHFKNDIEKNRKYLAYELQEELAQLVAALKMDISWVAATPGLPISSKARIENSLAISKLLITSLQRISFSLSPKMMDDFGLNATLEWLCKEFFILNGIPCSFESAYNEESINGEISTDFFRICQEALTNVIEHAAATSVNIRIEEDDDDILLSIIDNGKGFDTSLQGPDKGLMSMRQRAESINGRLTIHSEAGNGTRICVTLAKSTINTSRVQLAAEPDRS